MRQREGEKERDVYQSHAIPHTCGVVLTVATGGVLSLNRRSIEGHFVLAFHRFAAVVFHCTSTHFSRQCAAFVLQAVDAASLLRLLLNFDLLDAAAELVLEYVDALLGRGHQYFGIEVPEPQRRRAALERSLQGLRWACV